MTLGVTAVAPPIRRDATGTYRVGNTRLLLDLVVRAHLAGESPEAIADTYDVVTPADVYAVVAYYLRHKPAVDAYLADRERQAEDIRRRIEAEQGDRSAELAARIHARRVAGV
jgi:uncharacterized protein (DUF433 family)